MKKVKYLISEKMIDGKVKYNKSIYKLYLEKEYIDGQVCYKLKPIKLNSGYFTKKIFSNSVEKRENI